MGNNNLEKPCAGANYSHAEKHNLKVTCNLTPCRTHEVTTPTLKGTRAGGAARDLQVTQKKNYCDEDGICTAMNHDELIACQFCDEEEFSRLDLCPMLCSLGSKCNSLEANETAKRKVKYLST